MPVFDGGPTSRQRGIALIAVLAVIALVTFLIISYFSMTRFDLMVSDGYGKRISADELASGAADVLVQEFLNEIAAGSTIDQPNSPEPVFVPKFTAGASNSKINATGALPAKFTTAAEATTFPALLRRSAASFSFPGYYDFSSIPSPQLSSSVGTEAATPSARGISKERWNKPLLMEPSAITSFTPPNWIYWTEQGPNANPSAPDVVGRVAYVVYDTSGLLDANVAGFPASSAPAPSDEEVGAKGNLIFAKLESLGSMTASQSDTFSGWRYKNLVVPSFSDFVLEWAGKGYLTPPVNNGTTSGNRFVGRQDFLDYAKSVGLPNDALPYFTTFSRAVNESSWLGPTTPTSINPTIATLRKPDGSLFRIERFPLTRLDWFNDPAAHLSEIAEHFGLVPESTGSNPWDYVWRYEQAGTATGNIATLEDVAALDRQPDFFELLRAGINEQSLGQVATDRTHTDTQYTDGSRLRHVAQIGANIIDLADENNYPIEIVFPFADPGNPARPISSYPNAARIRERINGAEDLPYISEIAAAVYRDNNGNSSTSQRAYFPVEIWNPHRAGGPAVDGPTQFRVRAHDGVGAIRRIEGPSPKYGNPYFYDSTGVSISFPSSASQFREPTMLRVTNSSTTSPNSTLGALSAIPGPDLTTDGGTGVPQNIEFYNNLSEYPNAQTPTYSLEYSVGSSWRTYQDLVGVAYRAVKSTTNATGNSTRPTSWFKGMTTIDPRTTRFGLSEGEVPSRVPDQSRQPGSLPDSSTVKGTWAKLLGSSTFAPGGGNSFGATNPTFPAGLRYSNFATNRGNGSSEDPIYRDADSVTRPGDGNFDKNVNPMEAGDDSARPLILNRNLASVGELGYAGRDLPWKTLDFFSEFSADASLLDLFSVNPEPRIAAGKINLNSAPPAVIKAVVAGVHDNPIAKQPLPLTAIDAIAAAVVSNRSDAQGGPMINKADLVTRIIGKMGDELSWINADREAPARALADVANVRTWNLMFDIIAQAGTIPPSGALTDFALQGERRYWVHLAIDRFTGEVVDLQTELVYE